MGWFILTRASAIIWGEDDTGFACQFRDSVLGKTLWKFQYTDQTQHFFTAVRLFYLYTIPADLHMEANPDQFEYSLLF